MPSYPQQVSFENTEYAFAYKKTSELKKAHFLFKSMGNKLMLGLGLKLMPAAIKWHLPFSRSIIRNTIFSQFVGGETLEQTASVAKKLSEYNVQVILDYGVEGGDENESEYDHAMAEFIKVIEYASTQPNIPLMSIKVTGIVRFSLLEKMDAAMHTKEGTLMKKYHAVLEELPVEEKEAWLRAVNRLVEICETGSKLNVGVLVDAEETWIQDPVDAITMLMMDIYNKEKPRVYNTIQLYRHDRLAFLKACYTAADEREFILGAKLVRGAYMEKERKRAEEKKYASPIQPSKEASDRDYDEALLFCIDHIARIAVIVASHNEYSNKYAARLLDEKNIAHNHPHIHFSQLYGMSDNITFNLAHAGFSVSKYLPFGPIADVIPYLLRRAQENTSVAGQTSRELTLIEKEIKRRKG